MEKRAGERAGIGSSVEWRIAWLALLLTCAAFAIAYFPLRADDAYIVARYANNVAANDGLVFNVGEQINALTSPLHALILVVLRFVTTDTVFWYRLLGASISLATLVWVALRRWDDRRQALLFLALTAASPFVVFWSVGGLETPLLLAVITALAALTLKPGERSPFERVAVAALGGAAILTRYDASLFVVPVLVYWVHRHWRDPRLLSAVVSAGLVLGAWIAFTYFYYGDILPTSFYVKAAATPDWNEIYRGVIYPGSFGLLSLAWVAVYTNREQRRSLGYSPGWLAVAIGLLLYGMYGIFAGTKHMMYAYRLFVPFLPALLLLCLPPSPRNARARMPAIKFMTVAACLVFQVALGSFVYFLSQNPSIDLVRQGRSPNEAFEFSSLGARHTASFLSAVELQADAIRRHWKDAGNGRMRPMRVVVLTGGLLPYKLPEAYVLESLVSYRHRCRPPLEAMGDYQQVVFDAKRDAQDIQRNRESRGMHLIHRQIVPVTGLREGVLEMALEVWFQPKPHPLTLPGRITEACVEGTPDK